MAVSCKLDGRLDCVRLLVERGANVEATDVNAERPLSFACSFDHLDCASFLLNAGAEIDAFDKDRLTSLHWAVKNAANDASSELAKTKFVGVVKLLLGEGANATLKDKVRLLSADFPPLLTASELRSLARLPPTMRRAQR